MRQGVVELVTVSSFGVFEVLSTVKPKVQVAEQGDIGLITIEFVKCRQRYEIDKE